ncbi:MAG TPA: hypothetical protein PKW08_05235 [Flavobacteriaceae bacterium]|nr:hypothetical protein [Flavobacteriaceae bacterium]MCB9214038.1 hypothetical protein [Alteromonas sp.]HPF10817.1 hypothetical protein [Flavobacteriaceae bacterium]HQU20974.1 hypothetical protein [Flavobacteriaceae bacterium]HQU66284.1 hypothetical protein [Flavobacteriaceae bacterium]
METVVKHSTNKVRYNVTEQKKAELDYLAIQVLDAQHEVEQYQAMVNSLTEKYTNFQNFMASAEAKRDQAQTNVEMLDELVSEVANLQNNSNITNNEINDAKSKSNEVSSRMKLVVDKLIYSAEVINRLSNILIRNKELNPLISDELMSIMANAGKDANNAVALALVALKSTFASHAINMESQAALALEYIEAVKLNSVLTGNFTQPASKSKNPRAKDEGDQSKSPNSSLKTLIDSAYDAAKADFIKSQKAANSTKKQLDKANGLLDKAQVKLSSLQSGLAAANAAALAS